MENIIFKAKVGSHSYGTNIEGSDEDFKGVYIQTPEDVLENGYKEQYSVNKDETYYEIRRFVELCCTGNPTMIELLNTPEDMIVYKHPIFDQLLVHKEAFLSKSCKYSFGGYAISQIEKAEGLEKKMNWEKERTERKNPLDFCYIITPLGSVKLKEWLVRQRSWNEQQQKFYGVSKIDNCRDLYFIYSSNNDLGYRGIVKSNSDIQAVQNQDDEILGYELRLSEISKGQAGMGRIMSYNKDGYMRHCKDYKEYSEWLEKRNTQRYVDVSEHGQKIDGKNLLHCYRLLEMGIEIAQGKGVIVRRPNAEFLVEIRKGKHNLEKLLTKAKQMLEDLNKAYDICNLPYNVDRGFFLKLVIKIRKEYYGKTKSISL